jgi:hypothetical protein
MVLISLGYACRVRESIDRYNGFRRETNFFDWIISNFSFVLYVFQHLEKPEEFLTKDQFDNWGIFDYNPTHYYIVHNKLRFHSLHDLSTSNDYSNEMNLFIEKYRRRLKRLHETVLYATEKIHFIHMFENENHIPSVEEIYFFIVKIKEINSMCDFCIHLLVAPENHAYADQINKLKINENVEIHYMTSDPYVDPQKEQRRDLNWNEIYSKFL